MQSYLTTPGLALQPYWSGSHWQVLNIPEEQVKEGFPYVTADELLIDKRAGGVYFWAIWQPKHLGKGAFYLMGLRDGNGALFDGESTFRTPQATQQQIHALCVSSFPNCQHYRLLISYLQRNGFRIRE